MYAFQDDITVDLPISEDALALQVRASLFALCYQPTWSYLLNNQHHFTPERWRSPSQNLYMCELIRVKLYCCSEAFYHCILGYCWRITLLCFHWHFAQREKVVASTLERCHRHYHSSGAGELRPDTGDQARIFGLRPDNHVHSRAGFID